MKHLIVILLALLTLMIKFHLRDLFEFSFDHFCLKRPLALFHCVDFLLLIIVSSIFVNAEVLNNEDGVEYYADYSKQAFHNVEGILGYNDL